MSPNEIIVHLLKKFSVHSCKAIQVYDLNGGTDSQTYTLLDDNRLSAKFIWCLENRPRQILKK